MQCQVDGRLYSYGLATEITQYVVTLWVVVMMLVVSVGLVIELADPMQDIVWDAAPPWGGILAVLFTFVLLLLFSNMYPNFRISESGIAVQVCLLWWVFVPWEHVEDIRSISLPFSQTRLVIARTLPLVHRLIGLFYGSTLKPAFRISRKLKGYNEAVRMIEERIGKQ
jgi:hypothetical protein